MGLLFVLLYVQDPSRWSLMSYLHYWWWCHPCFDGDWHAHYDTWLPTPPRILFSTPWSRPLWSQRCRTSAMYGCDGQTVCHLWQSKHLFHYSNGTFNWNIAFRIPEFIYELLLLLVIALLLKHIIQKHNVSFIWSMQSKFCRISCTVHNNSISQP